jgi:hypothetical protein
VSRVLAVTAAIVLSGSLAYAGSGGGIGVAGALSPFKCYLVERGDNVPQMVDLADQFGTERVHVGRPILLCTPVSGEVVPGTGQVNPNDLALVAADHLACYDIRPPDDVRTDVTLENKLTLVPDRVTVRISALLCMPSLKELVLP